MGSLMAGWDSLIHDSKYEELERNKSVTKEGIEEFWNLRKKTEEDHLKSVSPKMKERLIEESSSSGPSELQRSQSLPMVDRDNGAIKLGKESHVNVEALRDCWWTRSNWAFLNEPPVIDGEVPKYKYASQYHIASLTTASPKPDTSLTSA